MSGSKYYAVGRGRSVGIYDNWNDCKRQVDGFSGNQYKSFSTLKEAQDYVAQGTQDPQSVYGKQVDGFAGNQYKGFSTVKEAQDYVAQGIQDPEALYGKQVDGFAGNQYKGFSTVKEAQDYVAQGTQDPQALYGKQDRYFLEFDGASKGNPGKAGAGAVLRYPDGSVACKIKEGAGFATNNVAEYRALIQGMKVCLDKGIDRIHVKGDSNLVVKQIQDKWKTTNPNIADLSKEAKELKSKFTEFKIDHVLREFNSEADALANEAIYLRDGEWITE